MSIEEKLDTIIESNPNITDKIWFKQSLEFVKEIYNSYGGDYDFSNILDIIKKLDIKNVDYDTSVYYDANSNSIIRGTSSENLYFDLCKTFLELSSQSYDPENNRYNRGLIIYNETGKINNDSENFNNYVISSMITNVTHLEKENEFDTTQAIILSNYLKNATDKIGAKELINYFAYAQGNEFYLKMREEEIKKGI